MNDTPLEEPSEELARLAQETIESQTSTDAIEERASAQSRCARVITLHQQGSILESRDHFHAALVLLYGETTEHYFMSRMFAHRAASLGEARAWTLQAMAWDRWLLSLGRPQRFGTQIVKQGGRWSLNAVDPTITDNERALYAVPPLFVQEQRAQYLQREEERGGL